MQASTCCSAPSASAAVAGAKGTPLWRRLNALQPALCLTTSKVIIPFPTASSMSYSFVVVPPPVPAATQSFESHIASLLAHVRHPVFITCTSYSPYFNSQAAENEAMQLAAAATSTPKEDTSTTQQALTFLNKTLPEDAGLVLTVTGTRTTTVQDDKSNNHKDEGGAPTTLTGASEDGIRAVIRDFAHRTALPTKAKMSKKASAGSAPEFQSTNPETTYRSGGLMVLRGDDGGYTQRCMAAVEGKKNGKVDAFAPNPYVTFANGAALLRFVSCEQQRQQQQDVKNNAAPPAPTTAMEESSAGAERDLCLLTGAYAQGHVLDRVWGPSHPVSVENDNGKARMPRQTNSSLRFLEEVEKVYEETEALLRHAQGSRGAQRPASVEACNEAVNALLRRLDAVRRLWQTPSSYPADVRAACIRWLINEKVLGGGGARVMVTQMLTSAEEFTQFADHVQRVLRNVVLGGSTPADANHKIEDVENGNAAAAFASFSSLRDPTLILVPGLMAPLRGEQFVRAALQLKVIPSLPLQSALEAYEAALSAARAQLQSAGFSPEYNCDKRGECAAVKAFEAAKEAAEVAFQHSMEDFTVALASDLHALGYRHISFSAFQYGCGEAVGRVVARLPH